MILKSFNFLYERYLSIFPVLLFSIFLRIYFDGNIFQLSDLTVVFFVFTLCLPFLNKRLFILNNALLPFYFFIIVSLYSSVSVASSELQLTSIKRFLIILIPSLVIVHAYANYPNIDSVFNKLKSTFILFVVCLCIYALVIYIFDFDFLVFSKSCYYVQENPFISNFQTCTYNPDLKLLKSHIVTNNFSKFGQIYYTREDLFGGNNFFYRPSSLFSNVIGFSQLILYAIIFMLQIDKIKYNFSSKIIFFLLLFSFFWTFSRINILILFILIPFLYFIINRKFLLSLVTLISTASFFLIINLDYLSFIIDSGSLNFIGSLFDRFELYELTKLNFNKYFSGLGFGISSESLTYAFHNQLTEHRNADDISLTSIPITVFVETGIFGLLCYTMIISYPIINTKKYFFDDVNNKHALVLLISIYFTQFFDTSLFRFHPTTFLFFVILGIFANKIKKIK